MEKREAGEILRRHGVRPTTVRVMVWLQIEGRSRPFTMKDVEGWMPFVDRSSIFRALRLFASNKMLHEIDDGSGTCKYCVCHCSDEHHVSHVHFVCTQCGLTLCLPNNPIPSVALPEGYTFAEAEYVVKGLCPTCAKDV